ncbi:MAG: hypothetical protein GY842_10690, partial [bacterium]|nr:hypothetical protein [bacterium]
MATAAMPALAAERTWMGPISSEWTLPQNWFPGQVPLATDDALLSEDSVRKTVNVGAPGECAILRFDGADAYTLQGAGGLTVTGISATGFGTAVTHTFNLDITPSTAGDWTVGQFITFEHTESLVGSGDVNKTGEGTLVLSGDNGSYTGDINVTEGELQAGVGNSLGDNTNVDVGASGTLRIVSGEAFGALSGSGSVVLDADGEFNMANQTSTFAGTMSGAAMARKSGNGTLTFTGANIYEGGTEVRNGTLILENTSGSATGTGDVEVWDGATLKGSGSSDGVATVLLGGVIAPGNDIGIMTLGGVTINQTAELAIQLEGLTPGSG